MLVMESCRATDRASSPGAVSGMVMGASAGLWLGDCDAAVALGAWGFSVEAGSPATQPVSSTRHPTTAVTRIRLEVAVP